MAARLEPKVKIPDCITGSSHTLHDLNHSHCEYVMRLRCDKSIHQLWDGRLVATMGVALG